MNVENYLTPKEAAHVLRRSVRTLIRMRAEGRGPKYHKEGGRILYSPMRLQEWLAHHEVAPPRSSS